MNILTQYILTRWLLSDWVCNRRWQGERLESTQSKTDSWRNRVRPWRRPDDRIAAWQLVSTFALWLLVWLLTVALWRNHPLTGCVLIPVHSVFMVRLFVLMHDCSHHSLFRSKRANDWIGFWLGTLFLTPHREWRRSHAIHHATSNCLQRRNAGDIYTMTEEEYLAAPSWRRLAYRAIRHPAIMLGLGPIAVFIIKQRLKGSLCEGLPHGRRLINVHATTFASLMLALLGCYLLGTGLFLTIWGASFWLAAAVGIFLFYMQHNFEDVYYAYDREDFSFDLAGVHGASFFDLPAWAHWCTGNIGYHHIHHLDPLIPNYRLPDCHRSIFDEGSVKHLSIRQSMETLQLKLLLPEEQRMITWREFRERRWACDR